MTVPERLKSSAWFFVLEVAAIAAALFALVISIFTSILTFNEIRETRTERIISLYDVVTHQNTSQFARLRALEFLVKNEQDLSGLQFDCSPLSQPVIISTDEYSRPPPKCWPIDLERAQIYGAKLHNAALTNVDFNGANLSEADLSQAFVRGATFEGAILVNTNFKKADLVGVFLNASSLNGADFSGANISGAYFGPGTSTGGAIFESDGWSAWAWSDHPPEIYDFMPVDIEFCVPPDGANRPFYRSGLKPTECIHPESRPEPIYPNGKF